MLTFIGLLNELLNNKEEAVHIRNHYEAVSILKLLRLMTNWR